MTNPVPNPATAMPLVQGVDPAYNDYLKLVPEDKRAEAVPVIQQYHSRVKEYDDLKKKYEPWNSLVDSGVEPNVASTAVDVLAMLENQPQVVYEALGRHLGVTPAQAKQMVDDEVKNSGSGEGDSDSNVDLNSHPAFQTMKKQLDTLSQITIANKQQEQEAAAEAEAEREIVASFDKLKKQHGDFPEKELLMRMAYLDMTAEQAYEDYAKSAEEIRQRRPAPFVLGSGGQVPQNSIDVTKLDDPQRKSLVVQMLRHANTES